MIRYTTGDVLRADVDAIVNTVNCVGVMGRGIALQFKKAFPSNYEKYRTACDKGEVVPGKMFITERSALTGPRFIVNFPTKRHWRGKSRIEDIESGLAALKDDIQTYGIYSIAIPPLGAGLGGLHWADVRNRIEEILSDLDTDIVVYDPGQAPDVAVMAKTKDAPTMSIGRATLITLVNRYLAGLLDPFITLIELHKLMYFMQEAGQPLRLKFRKHEYGPYADNLRHVLNAIEGHMVFGYADGGDAPNKQIELVPGAVEEAQAFMQSDQEAQERFCRVCDMVQGFETPYGLELLATVHWLVQHEKIKTKDEVVEKTHARNDRKRRFTQRQIGLAFDHLVASGWTPEAVPH